ncbi:conserved hypothetical protein [Kyrpidia tusciae DSM 2912]|uniref:Uracil-DNA glycosylase-like domain-containing protein n=2 Tax=Kyrpidia TaxID=1129704 RepID=D5WXR0_KYRT2|nr:conserved hypothetical protein [Kyrpidia tusciae DSM 2912]
MSLLAAPHVLEGSRMVSLSRFLSLLEAEKRVEAVFNPWAEFDRVYDIDGRAPAIRRQNLEGYLRPRLGRARHLLIAEGVGYQGARFSGIPLTSERMILGRHPVVRPIHLVSEGESLARTSNPHHPGLNARQQRDGFAEPTATILWEVILTNRINPFEVVCWNIFPLHPYDPKKGALSNRTPTKGEIERATRYTAMMIELFPTAQITAVGAKADWGLKLLGAAHRSVAHPANGHKRQFSIQLTKILGEEHVRARHGGSATTNRGCGR